MLSSSPDLPCGFPRARHLPGSVGTGNRTSPSRRQGAVAIPSRSTAVVGSPVELLVATRLVVTDLLQIAGLADPPEIAPMARFVIGFWAQGDDASRQYCEALGVPVTPRSSRNTDSSPTAALGAAVGAAPAIVLARLSGVHNTTAPAEAGPQGAWGFPRGHRLWPVKQSHLLSDEPPEQTRSGAPPIRR